MCNPTAVGGQENPRRTEEWRIEPEDWSPKTAHDVVLARRIASDRPMLTGRRYHDIDVSSQDKQTLGVPTVVRE